jgi:hypothetical protein
MTADTPFQLPLDSADATLQVVGGKGCLLGEDGDRLGAAGATRIPRHDCGLCRFVEANALQAVIAEATANAQPDDPASVSLKPQPTRN